MLGLKRGTVRLQPHQDSWPMQARQVMDQLREVLGQAARDIQHVGSTAISSICAKPILDIAVAMDDPERIFDFSRQMEERGIVFALRDRDQDGGILFVMGDFAADTRTCHIHVVAWQGEAWYNYVNFRDYLNAHPRQALEYRHCKEELAARYAHDRERYTAGKGPVIARLLKQAERWRKETAGKQADQTRRG